MTEYALLNVTAGIGIAADACLVTLAMYRWFGSTRRVMLWTLGVALTHTLFPMIGFYGGWRLSHLASRAWMGGLYAVCAATMAWLTHEAIAQETEATSEVETDPLASPMASVTLLMAVSYDALVVGVGKLPMTRGWSAEEIALSFLWVGGIVGGLVGVSGWVARALSQARLRVTGLPHLLLTGAMIEIGVFAFFTALAAVRTAICIWPGLPESMLLAGGLLLAIAVPVRLAPQILAAKQHESATNTILSTGTSR